MKSALVASALLLASLGFAQQRGQPPLQSTPPTFPEEKAPQSRMPPDQRAQPLSTTQLQKQIQHALNSEPALSNSRVSVKASENSVVLRGTVDSETQHGLALRIAQAYAGDRKIVDNIKVQQQT